LGLDYRDLLFFEREARLDVLEGLAAIAKPYPDRQTVLVRDDRTVTLFGTPGTTMGVLFSESESIRKTFAHVLKTTRGVYGLLDGEEWADLFWWRGEERSEEIPRADLPLAEIDLLVGRVRRGRPQAAGR